VIYVWAIPLKISEVTGVQVKQLGHAVLKVRDVQKAEEFYSGVLGLPVAARMEEGLKMTFFTLGNHHDFAIVEVDPDGPNAPENGPGLFHVAFKVGESLDELRGVKRELESAGVPIDMIADHTVSQSIYLRDPDGNGIELYIDCSDVWKTDPQAVATIGPLTL
jgi:catechol 2,3-dioxygenase